MKESDVSEGRKFTKRRKKSSKGTKNGDKNEREGRGGIGEDG